QVAFVDQAGQVSGQGVVLVAIGGLVRAPEAATVVTDHPVTGIAQQRHLRLPGFGRQRPAMDQDDGAAGAAGVFNVQSDGGGSHGNSRGKEEPSLGNRTGGARDGFGSAHDIAYTAPASRHIGSHPPVRHWSSPAPVSSCPAYRAPSSMPVCAGPQWSHAMLLALPLLAAAVVGTSPASDTLREQIR